MSHFGQIFMGIPFGNGCVDFHCVPTGISAIFPTTGAVFPLPFTDRRGLPAASWGGGPFYS